MYEVGHCLRWLSSIGTVFCSYSLSVVRELKKESALESQNS